MRTVYALALIGLASFTLARAISIGERRTCIHEKSTSIVWHTPDISLNRAERLAVQHCKKLYGNV